jgi:hypothetical protein
MSRLFTQVYIVLSWHYQPHKGHAICATAEKQSSYEALKTVVLIGGISHEES